MITILEERCSELPRRSKMTAGFGPDYVSSSSPRYGVVAPFDTFDSTINISISLSAVLDCKNPVTLVFIRNLPIELLQLSALVPRPQPRPVFN